MSEYAPSRPEGKSHLASLTDAQIEKAYLEDVNSPNPTKGALGDAFEREYQDRISAGRYPQTAAISNLVYDLSAGAGLLGGKLGALARSPYGRATDFAFNMLQSAQGGLASDPYGDYNATKNGRFVTARPTGYSGDVAGADAQDALAAALQWNPYTAIPATLASGSASLMKMDAARSKKAMDIREIQQAIKGINPRDPNAKKLMSHYLSLYRGLSGVGEIARGTTGQMAYSDLGAQEQIRRIVDNPLYEVRSASMSGSPIDVNDVASRAVKYGDDLINFDADVSKVQNSRHAITYPIMRGLSGLTDLISLDRALDTISGNLPGGYWSSENIKAYKDRRKFYGEAPPLNMAENGPDQREEIRKLAEEAYPGLSSDEYLRRRGEAVKAAEQARSMKPIHTFFH